MSHSVARVLRSVQCHTRNVAFAHADDLNRKRNTTDKTAEAGQGGTPCWQKSSCSDWKRQRGRPRKRPTARGLSRSHCRLRRRPRSQPNSKENAPTRTGNGPGLVIPHGWSAGADDQLTNAALAASFGARRYTEDKRKPRGCSQGFRTDLTEGTSSFVLAECGWGATFRQLCPSPRR